MSHRDRKKRQTKRQWIQAGKACFAREGFYGTSVARIAAEAGLSRPGFFLYFPSKKDLRAAIRLECLQALTMMASQEAARDGKAPERLQRSLERMTQWLQQERDAVRGCDLLASGLLADEAAERKAWERLATQLLVAADAGHLPVLHVWVTALLRGAWQQPQVDVKKLGVLLSAVLDAES